jgi:hypothetical protein
LLDGASLLDATDELRIDTVREAIASRLHLVPRFRQVIRTPRPRRGLVGRCGWTLRASISATTCSSVRFHPGPTRRASWR